MYNLFCGCTNLTNVTFSKGFDTANVIHMEKFFNFCKSLTDVILNFDTSNVDSMIYFFCDDTALKTVTLGGDFKPSSKYNSTEYMFYNCTSLNSIYVDSRNCDWSAANVSVREMFTNCYNLVATYHDIFGRTLVCGFSPENAGNINYAKVLNPIDKKSVGYFTSNNEIIIVE